MVGLESSRSPEQSTNAVNRSSTCLKAEERRSNYGRNAMQTPEILYEGLRHLVVEDPREARRVFLQLLDSGGPALDHFLGRISSPADGRLRQLAANALRNPRDRERLAPHLIAWQALESRVGNREGSAGAPLSSAPPLRAGLGLLRTLPAGARGRRRLL